MPVAPGSAICPSRQHLTFLTLSPVTENELTGSRPAQDSILLLIQIHSPEAADPAALYKKMRKWWRMRRVYVAERTVGADRQDENVNTAA